MLASVAIQILPETSSDSEVIRVVDEVIAYIKSTGLKCYVSPFETAIEGEDIDQLMDIVKECVHIGGESGVIGTYAFIKVSYRPDSKVLCIDEKISKYHQ